MRKVMILSASLGGGHHSTSAAIKLAFDTMGCEGIVVDSLRAVSPLLDRIFSDGYENSAKYTPKIHESLYKITDAPYLDQEHEVLMNTLLKRRLKHLIDTIRPELVVAVHPYPLMAVAHLRETGAIDIPVMAVLTDYTTHASWVKPGVNAYIIGSDDMRYLIAEEGADINKVYPFGIPVHPDFMQPKDLTLVKHELNLRECFTILLMGGSFGAGNMKDYLCELVELEGDLQIVAVTGRNAALKEKLDEVVETHCLKDRVHVLGFTRNIPELMSLSDILISKPGGLTTTEALLKQIPLVIPFYIPGQEEENVDFLLNHGLAFKTARKYTLRIIVQSLIDHPERLMEIKERMKRYAKPEAGRDMARLGIRLMEERDLAMGVK